MTDPDSREQDWLTPQVAALFKDPRAKHLLGFANYDDDEPEQLNYDRGLIVHAVAALHAVRSAEKQAAAIARATWALVFATVGLVVATIVLVVVTVIS